MQSQKRYAIARGHLQPAGARLPPCGPARALRAGYARAICRASKGLGVGGRARLYSGAAGAGRGRGCAGMAQAWRARGGAIAGLAGPFWASILDRPDNMRHWAACRPIAAREWGPICFTWLGFAGCFILASYWACRLVAQLDHRPLLQPLGVADCLPGLLA